MNKFFKVSVEILLFVQNVNVFFFVKLVKALLFDCRLNIFSFCVAFSPELTYHILSYQASVTYYSTNVIEIQICFTDTLCMRNMVKSFLYFLYIFYVFVHCKFCNTTGLFFVIFFSAP